MNKILSWDQFFLGVAFICSKKSKDPNTKVGCCIIDTQKRIVATGYNGFPKNINDDELSWNNKGDWHKTKYPYVIHAETNAILFAKQNLKNFILYTTLFPCSNCAKLIIQSEIKKIVFLSDKYDKTEDNIAAKILFDKAKIKYQQKNYQFSFNVFEN